MPLGKVKGEALPKPPSGKWSGGVFSPSTLPGYLYNGYNQVGKLQTDDEGTWQQETARAAADAEHP
jgi:hypothetical protein